jgi:outer membrane protein OmpA-like peptidoglycan-associated protein
MDFRKALLLFLFFFIVMPEIPAQPGRRIQRWFEEAHHHFRQQEYSLAVDRCEQILDREPDFRDARLLLADIYHETGNLQEEVIQLREVQKISSLPLITRRLGEALYRTGKYAEALACFDRILYEATLSREQEATIHRKSESCRFAMRAMENPVEFHPERLPGTVNSVFDEYWPGLSIDQQELVITRLIKEPGKQPQEDFYTSRLGPEGWNLSLPLTEINTPENEGAQSLSADGRFLFFTACNRPGGMGSCDIYYAERRNGRWTSPVNAGSPVNTSGWEAQPSLSSDGRYLYFSSNRSGGKGEKDLWRAECMGFSADGRLRWSEPENLGDSINTSGNEISPFMHAGSRDLYFASDFHTGMGGFDLFVSRVMHDSIFSVPRNLGYPVNTFNDEQGLHISADGLTAFFASERDSVSGLDIYAVQLEETLRPHPATYVRAQVQDAETGDPVQASIQLVHPGSSREAHTDGQGRVLLCLPAGKSYSFSVSREGYLFYSDAFDLREAKQYYDPYLLEIALQPVKAGAEMNLYNIYFETDSFRILPESEPELQKLVSFLRQNPSVSIEIQGHTDNTGRPENNMELSGERARSVAGYLIRHGVEPERLECTGYGQDKPVAPNDTAEGRRLNRRTTIKITDMDG